MENKIGLELLFKRPLEPVFTVKETKDGKATFDLPEAYYTDRYKDVAQDLETRFSEDIDNKISLKEPKKIDLSFANTLERRQTFSLFLDEHRAIATRLIVIFMNEPDYDSFLATAAFVRDRVHPVLFQYVLSVAVQHRKDTENFPVTPIAEEFPANFVEPSVFRDARREAELIKFPGSRMHVEIERNYTASDREQEHRLAYFREDIGINMHHWHWHLVYPTTGTMEIINKDRRGELFYYMHHQIQARYNAERFSNNLSRARPLNDIREPIPEAYFPKIISSLNNRTYPARVADLKLKDIQRVNSPVEVSDIERWRDRILQAIDQGFVMDTTGQTIPLDEVKGIDILGNLVEASPLSVNPKLYGNLHNMGHNMLAFAHDPDSRHLEDAGVMGDVTTAMRDPIFYRWHGFIDGIFSKFKTSLPQYTDSDLGYDGVSVNAVNVTLCRKGTLPNVLLTYWQKSDVDLAAGLDFGPSGSIFAHFTHLQHAPYNYNITVSNSSGTAKMGTCRIFICPRSDERGTALTFEEQRPLMIEMDKFTVNLTPGENKIVRRSMESSITIPFERSFRRIGADFQPENPTELAKFQFCGCGWPQHMLVPKGTPQGMIFDLFVMVSNYTDDAVVQTNDGPDECGDASSFCGLKDKLYPDKRGMGYPFDRRAQATSLSQLTSKYSNMSQQEISIKFSDTIVDKDPIADKSC